MLIQPADHRRRAGRWTAPADAREPFRALRARRRLAGCLLDVARMKRHARRIETTALASGLALACALGTGCAGNGGDEDGEQARLEQSHPLAAAIAAHPGFRPLLDDINAEIAAAHAAIVQECVATPVEYTSDDCNRMMHEHGFLDLAFGLDVHGRVHAITAQVAPLLETRPEAERVAVFAAARQAAEGAGPTPGAAPACGAACRQKVFSHLNETKALLLARAAGPPMEQEYIRNKPPEYNEEPNDSGGAVDTSHTEGLDDIVLWALYMLFTGEAPLLDMCDNDEDCDTIYFHLYGGTCTDYHPEGCFCEQQPFDSDLCMPMRDEGEECGNNGQCESDCCRGFMFWQTCRPESECN
jgi:hypothetical protein